MAFSDTIHRAWNDNRLFSVMFELTYACNLDCVFCYNDLALGGTPLSLEQYLHTLRDLHSMGVLTITFTGGEPLAHPHFFKIAATARELGFVVRIKSNGHAIHKTTAQRLLNEVDPYIIEVSLHGAKAETHEQQTRVRGSFARLLNNIQVMKTLGMRVKANSTLTRWNENEVEAMFDLCDDLRINIQFDPDVKPRDNGDKSPLSLNPSAEGIRRLRDLQRSRSKQQHEPAAASFGDPPVASDKHCGAGSNSLTIDPYGRILPCVQWREPVGNLHKEMVSEIWHTGQALTEVRETVKGAKLFVDGFDSAELSARFCPGAAMIHSGSALQLYPSMLEIKKIRLPTL